MNLPPIYDTDRSYDIGRSHGLAERYHTDWLRLLLIVALTFVAGVVCGWLAHTLYAPASEPGWAILLAIVVLIPVACVRRAPRINRFGEEERDVNDL